MNSSELISKRLNLQFDQVANTVKLLNEGNSVPFISRYRKDFTKGLKDFQVFEVEKELKKIEEFLKRKDSILSAIQNAGKLSDDLKLQIEQCEDDKLLEDLYLPFKTKRSTKADKARENGLEPLAKIIMSQQQNSLGGVINRFCKDGLTESEAINGVKDIIAEWISERGFVRNYVRKVYSKSGVLESKVKKDKEEEAEKYRDYFGFKSLLFKIPSHRFLALQRGAAEGFLTLSISIDKKEIEGFIVSKTVKVNGEVGEIIEEAVLDSFKRLIKPAIESEVLKELKEKSDDEAIKVFSSNLRQLLMMPPLGEKNILAIDPGYRSGCKVVCLDKNGNLKHNETIFPHPPQKEFSKSVSKISSLVSAYNINAIAIGNGTASRETENLIKKVSFNKDVEVYVVNEAGASVYSASKIGREEFPNYDVTVRGAVSIGRRLIDPLAELVKIDPKSIGVGQYQHDVDQTKLKLELDHVVESCVNNVGVNLNTGSVHLLKYVAGIGEVLAQNIVDYRKEHGDFKSREELKNVPRLGAKVYEQAAGFLRVYGGVNILDESAVHPENYKVVKQIAKDLGVEIHDVIGNEKLISKVDSNKYSIGEFTLDDILDNLKKPGLDPRRKIRKFEFDKSISTINDLKEGMLLPGLVENVTNFGAFVNIGIKEKGLIHLSEIADEFVSNPHDYLQLNDYVKAKVVSVDVNRKRIGLSLKGLK